MQLLESFYPNFPGKQFETSFVQMVSVSLINNIMSLKSRYIYIQIRIVCSKNIIKNNIIVTFIFGKFEANYKIVEKSTKYEFQTKFIIASILIFSKFMHH